MIETENTSAETSTDTLSVHKVGDRLPAAMNSRELMAVLGMRRGGFYAQHRLGKFKRFELKRAIGPRKYSGRLVQAYLDSRNE